MTKQELINEVALAMNETKRKTEEFLNTFLFRIGNALTKGEEGGEVQPSEKFKGCREWQLNKNAEYVIKNEPERGCVLFPALFHRGLYT